MVLFTPFPPPFFFLFKWDNYADHHLEAPDIGKNLEGGGGNVEKDHACVRAGRLELKSYWLVKISYKLKKTLGGMGDFFDLIQRSRGIRIFFFFFSFLLIFSSLSLGKKKREREKKKFKLGG